MWMLKRKPEEVVFSNFAKEIARWNYIARGLPDRSESSLFNQLKLVKEEIKELERAFDVKDKVEFLKEICDLFVVLSFYCYLSNTNEEEATTIELMEDEVVYDVQTFIDKIKTSVKHGCMQLALDYTCSLFVRLDANWRLALKAVVNNNYEKFVTDIDISDDELLKKAFEQHKGRYTGIHIQTREVDGKYYRILFDDNNKVLKPFTYNSIKDEQFSQFVGGLS